MKQFNKILLITTLYSSCVLSHGMDDKTFLSTGMQSDKQEQLNKQEQRPLPSVLQKYLENATINPKNNDEILSQLPKRGQLSQDELNQRSLRCFAEYLNYFKILDTDPIVGNYLSNNQESIQNEILTIVLKSENNYGGFDLSPYFEENNLTDQRVITLLTPLLQSTQDKWNQFGQSLQNSQNSILWQWVHDKNEYAEQAMEYILNLNFDSQQLTLNNPYFVQIYSTLIQNNFETHQERIMPILEIITSNLIEFPMELSKIWSKILTVLRKTKQYNDKMVPASLEAILIITPNKEQLVSKDTSHTGVTSNLITYLTKNPLTDIINNFGIQKSNCSHFLSMLNNFLIVLSETGSSNPGTISICRTKLFEARKVLNSQSLETDDTLALECYNY